MTNPATAQQMILAAESALLSDIRHEAMRYADRYGIEDADELGRIEMSMRYREFLQATEPMRKAKVRAVSAVLLGEPLLLSSIPGEPPRLADFVTGAELKCLALLDEMIQAEARRYGVAPAQEPQR